MIEVIFSFLPSFYPSATFLSSLHNFISVLLIKLRQTVFSNTRMQQFLTPLIHPTFRLLIF